MGRDTFHYTRLFKPSANLDLNTFREGTSPTSLGKLFQCLTTLTVKNFCFVSNLYLNLYQFKAVTTYPITTGPCKMSLSSFLVGLLQVLEGCSEVYLEPALLQAEQTSTLSAFPHRRGAPAL